MCCLSYSTVEGLLSYHVIALRGSLCCACTCAATALKFFTRPFVDGDSVLVQAAGGLVVSGVVEKTTGTETAWTASAL